MTSCPLCAKSKEPGWLCAEHPRKPWEHDGRGAERTQQKGMHSQEVRLANVPPILASPPASNLIAFSGNVLTIPD
jgi:hypothetical protein